MKDNSKKLAVLGASVFFVLAITISNLIRKA